MERRPQRHGRVARQPRRAYHMEQQFERPHRGQPAAFAQRNTLLGQQERAIDAPCVRPLRRDTPLRSPQGRGQPPRQPPKRIQQTHHHGARHQRDPHRKNDRRSATRRKHGAILHYDVRIASKSTKTADIQYIGGFFMPFLKIFCKKFFKTL